MKIQTFINTSKVAIPVLLLLSSMAATAGPHGFDLHNTLSPKAAGMAGTSLAGDSMGPVEAVYGNPANLTDFQGGTNFTFGATFYYPRVHLTHDANVDGRATPNAADNVGTILSGGQSYRTESQAEYYAVPQIAVTQDLAGVGVPIVLGLGFTAVSGIGVDYRDEEATNGAGAELIVFGVNVGAGYEFNEQLDLGAAVTLSYATFEGALAGSNAQGHDYGLRLTLGADYHLTDATDIALQVQSELRHKWDDAILLSNTADGSDANYQTLSAEQPRNYALGVSHKFSDEFRVMGDVIYKQWSEADFFERFYHDQTAVSVGVEWDRGPITWRAGYGYANDPNRDSPEPRPLEGHNLVCTGSPSFVGACAPLVGPAGAQTWRYLQALEVPVIYEHRLTAGMTWDGFLAPFLSLDAHIAHQIEETEDYDYAGVVTDPTTGAVDLDTASNTVTRLNVRSFHAGFALNWNF